MSYKKTYINKSTKSKKNLVKKKKLPFTEGRIVITSKTKNTFIVLTDENGKVFIKNSSGQEGFKNTLKKTSLAVETVTKNVLKEAVERGCAKFKIACRGFNMGRNVALREIVNFYGIEVQEFLELTRLPFGGCRPRKLKRN